MLRPSALLVCALVLTTATQAVVNSEAQRREAPLADTYGVPPSSPGALSSPELPTPIYGAPAAGHYPPPPPDVPPPPSGPIVPHKEYGVPVQHFGPPKINIEYGPPAAPARPAYHPPPRPAYGPPPQIHHQQHHQQQQQHFSHGPPPRKPQQHQSSFLESLFSTFGFGGGEEHHHHQQQQSFSHHGPSPHYGPPQVPKPVYGPPQHQQSFPKPSYGVPSFPAPAPKPVYGPPPKPVYGPPPSAPKPVYGPPKPIFTAQQSFGHHSSVHVPPTPPEIKCDGWKPIAGPVVQSHQHQQHQEIHHEFHHELQHQEVHSPESSYGPPPSGDFLAGGNQLLAGGDLGLQLPRVEPGPSFSSSGSGSAEQLHGSLELSKGNSFEVHSNFISDSYGAPPADSYAPGHYKPTFVKPLPPPPPKIQFPPSPLYGAPHHRPSISSYPGLGISHGSISGNLKPWSGPIAPPRQPIAYRPPVPQGLIESIGHTVEQLDNFRSKPHYSGDVYLPPPTSDVATALPALELNTLPSDKPAQPFLTQHQLPEAQHQIQEPRYHQQQSEIVSLATDCGHGPQDFGATSSGSFSSSDVSNSLDSSYGPPASGEYRTGHQLHQSSEHQHQVSNLPELDGGISGLELVSAQKSQSLTIPVTGQHGTYQLQFQSADPLGSGHGSGSAPHEQILSEGLLQSILSAIEQPQQGGFHQDEQSYDPNIDHSEVSVFLKSAEGQKTLADHPHKR